MGPIPGGSPSPPWAVSDVQTFRLTGLSFQNLERQVPFVISSSIFLVVHKFEHIRKSADQNIWEYSMSKSETRALRIIASTLGSTTYES